MLSSLASFLPSALHLNNNTSTQEYQQVGATINPDTEDEDEAEEDDARRNGNGSIKRSYSQRRQSTTEGDGQAPQGSKGAGKSSSSANEVGRSCPRYQHDDSKVRVLPVAFSPEINTRQKLLSIHRGDTIVLQPHTIVTFIFVRPPPSKSNHPLNLQVQLVPPHGRPPTGVSTQQDDPTTPTSARSRTSSNGGDGAGATSLVRTNSRRSEVYTVNDASPNTTPTSAVTNTSGHAHTNSNTTNASTSSFASTASFTFSTTSSSSSGGRRTIIPLYNLQAHNVMTNVIVDAGTDAKIARFQKRGIEMMEVGVLEPVEVWGEKERGRGSTGDKGKRRESLRLSVDDMPSSATGGKPPRNSFLQPGGGAGGDGTSATSSKTSLHSSSHSNLRVASPAPVVATGPTPFPSAQPLLTPQQQQQLQQLQNQQQQPPILDSATPTPIPVLPPQTQTQIQFMTQAPPQKRNIFNKLFNKRSSGLAPPPPPPQQQQQQQQQQQSLPSQSNQPSGLGAPANNAPTSGEPSFGTFSLHPAPVASKVMVQDFGRGAGKSKTPPTPLTLGSSSSPPSPPSLSVSSPSQSPSSQQTTPRQLQTPRPDLGLDLENGERRGQDDDDDDEEEGLVSPTPTIAPSKERGERGHGRNSSLTVPFMMNNPFKTTLIRSGKNRLSAVVGGGGAEKDKEREKEKEDKVKREERRKEEQREKERDKDKEKRLSALNILQKRASSPAGLKRGSRSQLSLLPGGGPGGGSNVDLNHNNHNHNNGFGGPLMLTQSQAREELSNLKQQQLALRPPVLGIQPTFVSPAVLPPPPPTALGASPLVAALSPRMSDASQENVLLGQRALMYVWLVRKWLKRRPPAAMAAQGDSSSSGIFGGGGGGESGLFGGFNLRGNQVPGLGYGGVEVRFEWKRAKVKGGKEKEGGRRTTTTRGGRASTGTVGTGGGVESDDEFGREKEREKRASVSSNLKDRLLEKRRNRMSTGSFSTTTASEEGGGGGGEGSSIGGGGNRARPRREGTIDDGEDSDPEDSETPWVCTLKIRRMPFATGVPATDMISPPATAFSDTGFSARATQPQVMRLKVGTLSPTPHHPKVVAMLKVPFPLPDVEVERMGVVRRKGYPPSEQQREGDQRNKDEEDEEEEGREPYYGLTLTAEEIKDIVCSTGLWLVVREGFGGVGRVSRKGDGWRIRA
ncbi:hypothetical protein M413DRAFT_410068 [Hebeloma cylindrosporum]|uniref:Uncharacterized protein n=1 Tax=Hebeloma cylindrosporum TaxID=76867 RepID=A0A0C3CC19_HEBCY|nr:hypothetical protein M413DRAFT_410068 [Hebeloma cylindrosporum h7]